MSWARSRWSWGETARWPSFPGTGDETDNALYFLESCVPAGLLTSSHCFYPVSGSHWGLAVLEEGGGCFLSGPRTDRVESWTGRKGRYVNLFSGPFEF